MQSTETSNPGILMRADNGLIYFHEIGTMHDVVPICKLSLKDVESAAKKLGYKIVDKPDMPVAFIKDQKGGTVAILEKIPVSFGSSCLSHFNLSFANDEMFKLLEKMGKIPQDISAQYKELLGKERVKKPLLTH